MEKEIITAEKLVRLRRDMVLAGIKDNVAADQEKYAGKRNTFQGNLADASALFDKSAKAYLKDHPDLEASSHEFLACGSEIGDEVLCMLEDRITL